MNIHSTISCIYKEIMGQIKDYVSTSEQAHSHKEQWKHQKPCLLSPYSFQVLNLDRKRSLKSHSNTQNFISLQFDSVINLVSRLIWCFILRWQTFTEGEGKGETVQLALRSRWTNETLILAVMLLWLMLKPNLTELLIFWDQQLAGIKHHSTFNWVCEHTCIIV